MSLLCKERWESNAGRENRGSKGLEKERPSMLSRKEGWVSCGLGNGWFGLRLGRSTGARQVGP